MEFAICDDDKIFRDDLINKIKNIGDYGKIDITIYDSGKDLVKNYNHTDAVFLDIRMPGLDGFMTAQMIKDTDKSAKIIFITNYDEMVYQSFEYAPFRFLRKNLLDFELKPILDAVYNACKKERSYIRVKLKEGYANINIDDIKYMDVYNHIVTIHLKDRDDIKFYSDLISFEKELSEFGFIRISKSFLVNSRYVFAINSRYMTIDDGTKLNISRKNINTVRDLLHKYMSEFD